MPSLIQRLFGARKIVPQNPDVIICPSYGVVSHEKLAEATEQGIRLAVKYAQKFPHAYIAYATISHCFRGSEEAEFVLKRRITYAMGIAPSRVFTPVTPGQNTVTELRLVKEELDRRGIRHREILFVCEPLHARSVLLIAKKIFPRTKFSLAPIDTSACQSDHPFAAQRRKLTYFKANVLREAALRVMGVEWVGKHKHKAG